MILPFKKHAYAFVILVLACVLVIRCGESSGDGEASSDEASSSGDGSVTVESVSNSSAEEAAVALSQVSREKAAEILSQLSPEAASNIVIKIEKPLDALEIMRKMELAVAEKVVTTLINSVTVEEIKKFTTKRTLPSGRVVDNTTMVIENLKKDEAGGLLSKMEVTRAATIVTVLPEATAVDWGVSMLAQNPDGATASMVAIVEAGGKRNAAAMLLHCQRVWISSSGFPSLRPTRMQREIS